MTILQALNTYYDRMAARGEAEAPGWSREKFGYCVVLSPDGAVVDITDLRDPSVKKPVVKLYQVPAGVKRTVGIASNFLWDKSAYVLGCTAGEGKRTEQEHDAFRALHAERLAQSDDEGLIALRRFLDIWRPEQFAEAPFTPDMLDANFMFRLDGDVDDDGRPRYLHDRPAARALVQVAPETDGADGVFCLITGERGPEARLHPTIKGVEGAQSAGAALVSFNLDAFKSLGKDQGANAPTGKAAAFRYGVALNRMLDRSSVNRVPRPIGDATVVFWADASDAIVADAAEDLFARLSRADEVTDAEEGKKLSEKLAMVAQGRPMEGLDAELLEGTRFHILGLSPNAARLSVRFWETGSFGDFARRLQQHFDDMRIDPAPRGWGAAPSVNRILVKSTALQEKFDNIPNALAGEVMRAVLTGGRYPQTLLSAAIMRLRAGDKRPKEKRVGDDPLIGWYAAVIRAVLTRDHRNDPRKEDVPMSLAPDEPNTAYQLGRLFAVLETAQRKALVNINATIRDRYFGAASATPASVFPLLLRGAQNHLGKLRKDRKDVWLEAEIENILDKLTLDFPRSLPLMEQGRFAIGYYHQRKEQSNRRPDVAAEIDQIEGEDA